VLVLQARHKLIHTKIIYRHQIILILPDFSLAKAHFYILVFVFFHDVFDAFFCVFENNLERESMLLKPFSILQMQHQVSSLMPLFLETKSGFKGSGNIYTNNAS